MRARNSHQPPFPPVSLPPIPPRDAHGKNHDLFRCIYIFCQRKEDVCNFFYPLVRNLISILAFIESIRNLHMAPFRNLFHFKGCFVKHFYLWVYLLFLFSIYRTGSLWACNLLRALITVRVFMFCLTCVLQGGCRCMSRPDHQSSFVFGRREIGFESDRDCDRAESNSNAKNLV